MPGKETEVKRQGSSIEVLLGIHPPLLLVATAIGITEVQTLADVLSYLSSGKKTPKVEELPLQENLEKLRPYVSDAAIDTLRNINHGNEYISNLLQFLPKNDKQTRQEIDDAYAEAAAMDDQRAKAEKSYTRHNQRAEKKQKELDEADAKKADQGRIGRIVPDERLLSDFTEPELNPVMKSEVTHTRDEKGRYRRHFSLEARLSHRVTVNDHLIVKAYMYDEESDREYLFSQTSIPPFQKGDEEDVNVKFQGLVPTDFSKTFDVRVEMTTLSGEWLGTYEPLTTISSPSKKKKQK